MIEQTCILIKPDGVERKLVGKILARFENEGFDIVGLKLVRLTQPLLDIWYSHHKDKPFFPDLCKFMMSTPVVAVILKGENIVNRVRDVIGPTDSTLAPKGTIRGDLGESKQKNLVHASDSPDRAIFEINLLFKKEELFTK